MHLLFLFVRSHVPFLLNNDTYPLAKALRQADAAGKISSFPATGTTNPGNPSSQYYSEALICRMPFTRKTCWPTA
jgi:hypothetical protein